MAQQPITDVPVLNMEWIVSGVALSGLALMFYSFFGGLVLVGVAMVMFGYGIKEIPANPPHKGLVTVWGKRTTKVKDEGYKLIAPYFPFFIDTINVLVVTINQDIKVELYCRAAEDAETNADESYKVGLQVRLSASITFKPSVTGIELQQYLNNGGEVGVRSILDDIFPQVLRVTGTQNTFEQLTASKQPLIDTLTALVTGEDLATLSAEEKQAFYKDMKTNGRKDILGLGIVITKINVGEPELLDEAVKKAAESKAREQLERRGEVYEVETEIHQARALHKAYQEAGELRSLESCINEIRRRKSIREGHGQVFDVTGLEGLAAAFLGKVASNSNPSGTPSSNAPPPSTGGPHKTRRRQNP